MSNPPANLKSGNLCSDITEFELNFYVKHLTFNYFMLFLYKFVITTKSRRDVYVCC